MSGKKVVQRKNLVHDKFGFGVRRKREPLSEETKAFLMEKIARHKEWMRQGEHFKNHSQQRFGGN